MVYVKRKERETIGSMLRRFTRRIQQSGVLIKSRKDRYFIKPPTKRARKARALRRLVLLKEREKLAKLGKLPEKTKRTFSR